MAQMPHASIKDLLSTGYFFEDLKNYSQSTEIDLPSYSRDFLLPYLIRTSVTYEESGQPDRSKILNLAIRHLSDVNDEEMSDSIFELKKVAASEIDINEKALYQIAPLDKCDLLSCRQKSESAKSLAKLLVSTIRMFKLAEVTVKREKSPKLRDSTPESTKKGEEHSAAPGM